jgi:large subunit ribosomal protein L31
MRIKAFTFDSYKEKKMKANIHPEFFDAQVSCVCGHTWSTKSTKKELRVDICSNCHPFYTGKQKLVDVEGRVEKFQKRYANFSRKATPAKS